MVRTIEPIANRRLKPIYSVLIYAINISSCPHLDLGRLRNRANRSGEQPRRSTYLRNQWFGILWCYLGPQPAETVHLRCRDARLSGKELTARDLAADPKPGGKKFYPLDRLYASIA